VLPAAFQQAPAEAEAAASISDFRRERDAAGRTADRARQSGATLLLARAEEQQGEALRALGSFSEALALWKDAETRYTAIGDRSAVARLLIDQGRVRRQQGDPAGAEASDSEAVSISQQTGDEANLGRALTALAQVRMFYVSSAEGNRLCKQALAIFRRTGNKQEEAYTLSIMADILSSTDRSQAIRLYQQSLELSREVNDRSRTAGRLMDLGIQATVQGDLDSADKYLQQSLALYSQIGERNREALQMNLLALVRTWEGRLNEADHLSNQAVAALTSVRDAGLLAQSRQTLGTVQMEEGRLADAESTLKHAVEEWRNAHDPGGVAIASGQLAEVLLQEGKVTPCKAALSEYDAVRRSEPKGRPFVGEHVTDRNILVARMDAAEGKLQRARSEAMAALNQAVKWDQGSMLMKARLALGEIELQSANPLSGRRDLEALTRDADNKGFGLISRDARRALANASEPSHVNQLKSAGGSIQGGLMASATGP
jgi:tetratricopeptide (TPR) repeat protein